VSSQSGTKRTEIDQLCKLMEIGSKIGATRIQYREFCVEFGEKRVENKVVTSGPALSVHEVASQSAEEIAKLAKEVEEARMEQLLIEDPVEFDRRMREGALELVEA